MKNSMLIFKKSKEKEDKNNYRLISILPNITKVFKDVCVNKSLHILRIIFLVNLNVRLEMVIVQLQYLFLIIEKWKAFLDQGKSFVTFLTGLSKIFNSLPHGILITKLKACGFDESSFLIK